MKFEIGIENTETRFKVTIYNQALAVIFECGWHGGEFEYQGKLYAVYGPYHGLSGQKFRVYELVPVSDVK